LGLLDELTQQFP